MSKETPEEAFARYQDMYYERFGDVFPRGYGAPTDYGECVRIMRRCIDSGEEYDPYDGPGIPPDAIF